ncbi:hypothetical protein L9F63_027915, partial [Diploptera punctata]
NSAASVGTINGTQETDQAFAKLLSFGKNSTPLVFERKRNGHEVSSTEQQTQICSENTEDLDLSNYPKLSSIPKQADVIAFKILKIGENYTPKISNYIMAKVVSVCKSSFQMSLSVIAGDKCQNPKREIPS